MMPWWFLQLFFSKRTIQNVDRVFAHKVLKLHKSTCSQKVWPAKVQKIQISHSETIYINQKHFPVNSYILLSYGKKATLIKSLCTSFLHKTCEMKTTRLLCSIQSPVTISHGMFHDMQRHLCDLLGTMLRFLTGFQ